MFIGLSQHTTGELNLSGGLSSTQDIIDRVVRSIWGKLSRDASELGQTVALLQRLMRNTAPDDVPKEIEGAKVDNTWSICSNRLLFSQLLGIELETSQASSVPKWHSAVNRCPLLEKRGFSELLEELKPMMRGAMLLAPLEVGGNLS